MATFVRRATVAADLAHALGLARDQDGGQVTAAAILISQDNKDATAELVMALQSLPRRGLMRAMDYHLLLGRLQQARVVMRRAGKKGDPTLTLAADAWADRIQRVAAFPAIDLLERVGPLEPGLALVTAATHARITGIVREARDHARNGGGGVY